MAADLTPWEFLLRLLAVTWDPRDPGLTVAIPWAEVAAQARRQGVDPLLRAAIAAAGLAAPRELAWDLDRAYFKTAAANAFRFRELGALLAAFSAAGVPVLVLKGAALARTSYDNLALRPMGDFDLLVAPRHLPACRDILVARGYGPTEVEIAPGSHLAYRNEQAFVRREPFPLWVELHWHLVDVPYYVQRLPVAWFWENSHAARLAGQEVQVLDAEANLLYLAAHLALHHRFRGLRWFVDLAWLLHESREDLDWEKILAAAQAFELLLVVRQTLERLAAYWPALALEEPLRRLRALQPTPAEARIYRLLAAEPRSALLDFYTDLVCLPGLATRLRFAWANVFPQPAYMRRRYAVKQGWQLPAWYLYRLIAGVPGLARTLSQVLRLEKRQNRSPA